MEAEGDRARQAYVDTSAAVAPTLTRGETRMNGDTGPVHLSPVSLHRFSKLAGWLAGLKFMLRPGTITPSWR
jgi:hypothetical protein